MLAEYVCENHRYIEWLSESNVHTLNNKLSRKNIQEFLKWISVWSGEWIFSPLLPNVLPRLGGKSLKTLVCSLLEHAVLVCCCFFWRQKDQIGFFWKKRVNSLKLKSCSDRFNWIFSGLRHHLPHVVIFCQSACKYPLDWHSTDRRTTQHTSFPKCCF